MMIKEELIESVIRNLSTQFERDLLYAAIENITKSDSPIRFNNFAYAIRELTRHILEDLAPDENVLKSQWYKKEPTTLSDITRPQRVYYAIHGGLDPLFVQDTLGIDIPTFKEKFDEIIRSLNKFTHIEPDTFGLDEEKTFLYANHTLEVFLELFAYIEETKESLSEALHENIGLTMFNAVVEETFSEVDILATHHYLEDVGIETIETSKIDHKFVYIQIEGYIEYEMQWGSNSDLKQGDGLLFYKSFPFKCQIECNVRNLTEIKVDIASIEIDTSENE